jgi:transposase
MNQKSSAQPTRVPAEKLVRDIRRAMRKHHSAEGKILIVLEGLRGEESIANIGKLGSETFTFSVPFPTAEALRSPGNRLANVRIRVHPIRQIFVANWS